MTKDEALTLEALKYVASKGYGVAPFVAPFTIKRDEALAQPVQEPVLEPACPVCSATPTFSLDVRVNEWSGQCKHCGVEGSPATTEAEAKQKWIVWHHKRSDTTPPKRPWVGLTDDEHCDIWYKESLDWMEYGKAIEAKLKDSNT